MEPWICPKYGIVNAGWMPVCGGCSKKESSVIINPPKTDYFKRWYKNAETDDSKKK
jgi:hypothetical protein